MVAPTSAKKSLVQEPRHETRQGRISLDSRREKRQVIEPPAVSAQGLEQAIWRILPFSDLAAPVASRSEIVKAFADSRQRLVEARKETLEMLRAMFELNCEVRSEGDRDETVAARDIGAEEIREELRVAEAVLKPIDGQKLSETIGGPVDKLYGSLKAELGRLVSDFSQSLFQTFDALVENESIGSVRWVGECFAVCECHYFKQVFIEQDSKTSSSHRANEVVAGPLATQWRKETWKEVTSIDVTHRVGRHECEIMDARVHRPDAAEVDVPEDVRKFLVTVPSWLGDAVRIITGDQFSGRIVERDVSTQTWKDVLTRESYSLYHDPVITVGKYVLTGWGKPEIQSEDRKSAAKRFRVWKIAAAAVQGVALFVFAWALLVGARWLVAGPILSILGIVPCIAALQDSARARGKPLRPGYVLCGTLALLAASIGTQLVVAGFFLFNLQAVVFGVLLLGAVYPSWLFIRAFS